MSPETMSITAFRDAIRLMGFAFENFELFPPGLGWGVTHTIGVHEGAFVRG